MSERTEHPVAGAAGPPSATGAATRADTGGDAGAGASTRDALLAAARRLFARRGYDGTSIRAVTRQAGANLGAVTYHFGSKRGLYAAVLEEGLRPIQRRVMDAVRSGGTARARMLKVVEAYFRHFEEHPDLPQLLLQEVAAGKEPPGVVLEIIGTVKDALVRLQAEGERDGSVRPGHPVLTALSVVSQPVYFTLISPLLRRAGGVDLADPAQRRMALEHCLAFVDAGLRPDTGAPPAGLRTTGPGTTGPGTTGPDTNDARTRS